MVLTLKSSQVESLLTFVDGCIRLNGCDQTHRFTRKWARRELLDWDDFLDILEDRGVFCDCEVVLNLPGTADLRNSETIGRSDDGNPWLIPPTFACSESAVFQKLIVCRAEIGRNTYGSDAEILIPAPRGAKARRRVRKSVNFFIGCQSGMPSEVGVVQECDAVSAGDFAEKVAHSGIEELARFGFREAAFVLSRAGAMKPGTTLGTDFADRVGITSKHKELTVYRVIMRR